MALSVLTHITQNIRTSQHKTIQQCNGLTVFFFTPGSHGDWMFINTDGVGMFINTDGVWMSINTDGVVGMFINAYDLFPFMLMIKSQHVHMPHILYVC